MLSLSVALVAKSLDGDVGTQAKEEKNKLPDLHQKMRQARPQQQLQRPPTHPKEST